MATTASQAALQALEAVDFPADAIEVGRVLGAWGVQGALKVLPHASDPQALHASRRWFLRPAHGANAGLARATAKAPPALLHIVRSRDQAGAVVATAREVEDRDAAQALAGCPVFVSRASFPTAATDEYYWVDLLGAAVHNREGLRLGVVDSLIDTGAHSVLRVVAAPEGATADGAERLIPFVAQYVDDVDIANKRITVDWQPDY